MPPRAAPSRLALLARRGALAALAALSGALFASCPASRSSLAEADGPRALLRYAEERGANHPAVRAADRFATLLERGSGGALLVRVSPGGRFGSEESLVEQLRFGGIDMARVRLKSLALLSPAAKELAAAGLPAGRPARSLAELEAGRRLEEELESSMLLPLAWYDGGSECRILPRGRGGSGFDGLRIGVDSSQASVSFVVGEGGMPIPLALRDFRRALDTGLVDGFYVPLLSAWSERLMESMEVAILPESRSVEVLVASRSTFMRLLPVDREAIRATAAESESFQDPYYDEALSSARTAAGAGG